MNHDDSRAATKQARVQRAMRIDDEFYSITNELVATEASDLLDKQLERVVLWRESMIKFGERADVIDLIRQMHSEPSLKGPVVATLAIAMWRLLQADGRIDG